MERSPRPEPVAIDDEGARFERAAAAVVDGDLVTLAALLAADPGLATARSQLVTDRHPPVHRATLLHYVAANGVEDARQRSPRNAAEVARLLLDAGAALGGHDAVVRLLVERGARIDPEDTIYRATPAGWAEHGGHPAIAAYLRARLS